MRDFNAALLAPIMKRTNLRFSKNFRHGKTASHRLVYSLVNTVLANYWAGV